MAVRSLLRTPSRPQNVRILQRPSLHTLHTLHLLQVVLLFQTAFWDANSDFFGIMLPPGATEDEYMAARGEFFLFWNMQVAHAPRAPRTRACGRCTRVSLAHALPFPPPWASGRSTPRTSLAG